MPTRRSIAASILLVVGLAMLGVRSFGADENAAVDIVKRQQVVAEKALERIAAAEAHGTVSAGLSDVPKWSKRLVEATRKSGATKEEVIATLKQHMGRMTARYERLAAKSKAGFGATSDFDVLDAEFDVLEAKGWLDAEQGK